MTVAAVEPLTWPCELRNAVFHGSSDEYCGAGDRTPDENTVGASPEVLEGSVPLREGALGENALLVREERSREGSGRLLCDASAATCSILRSSSRCKRPSGVQQIRYYLSPTVRVLPMPAR